MTFDPSALFQGGKKKKRVLDIDCDMIHFSLFIYCSFSLSPSPSPKVDKMALMDLGFHGVSAKQSQVRSEFRNRNKQNI